MLPAACSLTWAAMDGSANSSSKLAGFHSVGGSKGRHLLVSHAAFNVDGADARPIQIRRQAVHMIPSVYQFFFDRRKTGRASFFIGADPNLFCLQNMLVSRFSQIQVPIVDIILRHDVDQIGDVPVEIDIFSDPRRADIFIIFFQGQTDHFTRNGISFFLAPAFPLLVGLAGKGDMVQRMNGVPSQALPCNTMRF